MPKTAIALGTFDGLHLGHLEVLNGICKSDFTPLALTFDTPPKMSDGKNLGLILTPEQKKEFLLQKGIKTVTLDFEEVKNLSPYKFLSDITKKLSPKVISCGFNFRFGKNASGDADFLKKFCLDNSIECIVSDSVLSYGEPISSTRIREAISKGDITLANKMLGRNFGFTAPVIHGDKRGRTIGFPTINQKYPSLLVAPRFGVYAGYTNIDGRLYRSVTNIGKRPTFETDYIISETYIFDFDNDIYGKEVAVYLTSFLRDEVKFSGIEELKNTILADKKRAEMELNLHL